MCGLLACYFQLGRHLVIYILRNYVCCRAHVHLFLDAHTHAAEHVQQNLPLHPLESCDGHSVSCSAFRLCSGIHQ